MKKGQVYAGLYLIVDTNQQWVKVGQSSNIPQRLKTYHTHNPSFTLVETKHFNPKMRSIKEKQCHKKLKELSIKQVNNEWFQVTPIVFDEIMEGKIGHLLK